MRLPSEVTSDEGCSGAIDLCLEFWRGWIFLGTYKLPLAKIRQALTGQVHVHVFWLFVTVKCYLEQMQLNFTLLTLTFCNQVGLKGALSKQVELYYRAPQARSVLPQPEPGSPEPFPADSGVHVIGLACTLHS